MGCAFGLAWEKEESSLQVEFPHHFNWTQRCRPAMKSSYVTSSAHFLWTVCNTTFYSSSQRSFSWRCGPLESTSNLVNIGSNSFNTVIAQNNLHKIASIAYGLSSLVFLLLNLSSFHTHQMASFKLSGLISECILFLWSLANLYV